jgi:hypothetical protein
MSTRKYFPKYRVTGSESRKFAVVMRNGVIEYDLIDTRKEAKEICDILNDWIGPEWNKVEPELKRRRKARP